MTPLAQLALLYVGVCLTFGALYWFVFRRG